MKNNRGQALVEFVIVLPILLLVIMTIIDFGNIFTKKYSLENDLDVISNMYREEKYNSINKYVNDKNISINYENEDEFIIINLNKTIKINTPILNNIIGKNYKLTASRAIYE